MHLSLDRFEGSGSNHNLDGTPGPSTVPYDRVPLSPGGSLKVNLGLRSEWAAFDQADWANSRLKPRTTLAVPAGRLYDQDDSCSQRETVQEGKGKEKDSMGTAGSDTFHLPPLGVFPEEDASVETVPYLLTRYIDDESECMEVTSVFESMRWIFRAKSPNSDTESDPDFLPSPGHSQAKIHEEIQTEDQSEDDGENDGDDENDDSDAGEFLIPETYTDADGHLSLFDSTCEFSVPCHMGPSPDGKHYRKVVSHFFGRNKASTKLFPDAVWVHYCRKHYQRARYRADQWPFTQCELLLESLSRMEQWDGVESFEITLRRREIIRVEGEEKGFDSSPADRSKKGKAPATAAKKSSSRSLVSGRKLPRAVIAPVPEWLREFVGRGKSFDEIRAIVERIHRYMAEMREEEKAQLEARNNSGEGPSRNAKKGKWLPARNISQDIERVQESRARFPDIEILPTFKPWVLQAALRQREQQDTAVEEVDQNATEEDIEAREQYSDTTQIDHDNDEHGREELGIGRTGLNRGNSASQRRRNDKSFVAMVTRSAPRKRAHKSRQSEDRHGKRARHGRR
ncbi:pathogenicity factor [Penicillium lividum]|nr:pathogenicity factor [Penicillium lividum]